LGSNEASEKDKYEMIMPSYAIVGLPLLCLSEATPTTAGNDNFLTSFIFIYTVTFIMSQRTSFDPNQWLH